MDVLKPGHAHRSSSDRLLNNYLDAQKGLTTSLLTLLSHSHSSTSSLLAYVTSSPGVIPPVRRAVRHAAFEGPLSPSLLENPAHGSQLGSAIGADSGTPGWAAYVSSLEQFRKDLKQIHLLEEEISRVKRDREILVTRLIKSTKSRPTKNDLSAMATSYSQTAMSSRASSMSVSSTGSAQTKEGKRASKLADAQAELLGCEEHLRGLEVRIEGERNKVMMRGLEERFRAMEVVGQMWLAQAKRGMDDLEKMHGMNPEAFEVDSNGSLAPYESASQTGYEDRPTSPRPYPKSGHGFQPPGSISGSIAEEDEDGSSADEAQGRRLVMHENRPGAKTPIANGNHASHPPKPSPLGVPSVVSYGQYKPGGRRAASDIGAPGYSPITRKSPLRRTFSQDEAAPARRGGSDTSSIRQGSIRKKKGFFASISRFFKGPSSKNRREGSIRSGRESPAYGAGKGWHTRTDSNIKRASSFRGARRSGNDSSSDDEPMGLMAVSNDRNNTWSVDNVGRANSVKRNSNLPVASGLIPPKPTKSDLGGGRKGASQSTLTARSGAATPKPRAGATSPAPGAGTTGLVRSNTARSTKSVKSTGTAATVKSTGTAKKTRPNGSIARANAAVSSQQAAEGRNIMSLVDLKSAPAPVMPDVPKAPKSHVTPQLELPKAPGSSIIPPSASAPTLKPSANQPNGDAPRSLSRASSAKRVSQVPPAEEKRSTTPLPPSRTLVPPLKSALRATSPLPGSQPKSSPPATAPDLAPPIQMYSVSAPGPVHLPKEEKIAPPPRPLSSGPPPAPSTGMGTGGAPVPIKRDSYQSVTTEGGSVYESANENFQDAQGGETSDSESEMEFDGYDVVENTRNAEAGAHAGPPAVERIPRRREADDDIAEDGGSEASRDTAPGGGAPLQRATSGRSEATTIRRKSVRMAVPDSPVDVKAPPPILQHSERPGQDDDHSDDGAAGVDEHGRPASPEPERPSSQWSSRVTSGVRDDESEDDSHDEGYMQARKGLQKNTGRYEALQMAREAGERLKAKRSNPNAAIDMGGSPKRKGLAARLGGR